MKIHSILLYESVHKREFNNRPLHIALSTDGQQWQTVATVTASVKRNEPVHIEIEKEQTARYVRLQATGYCGLRLDEVEVYGPEK